MNIILMGLPGAGKGTQAEKISENYKIVHISTGDMFREAISKKSELGRTAQGYMDQGQLVPDEVTSGIVKERIAQEDVQQHGFMLDGFPRTLVQAETLDQIVKELKTSIDRVVNIKVDPEDLVERLSGRFICRKCGATYHKIYNPPKVEGVCDVCGSKDFYQRDDDKPEVVRNRLEVNIEKNTPLIAYYEKQGKLSNIDGNKPINEVFDEIKKVLEKV
ncbi:adenylate kinase [Xylocopilactobacillus apis]|uniref:Adenylate kinase n=1 Tax=Xylocopilactobacillus apis TaxID=2932183 RepID=A0AAU9D760_9LACO|nr:adenylate kinase [Xylocopilactobacillus apis]BDR57250.1 adenylate kinase [Xylocopilactobacillus apis]